MAVADLLDEDSNRCDTITLIKHRQGSMNNLAHWIRHALTVEISEVQNSQIFIKFRRLNDAPADFELVYRCLRNHFRLILLYNDCLKEMNAEIKNLKFSDSTGLPEYEDQISQDLVVYRENLELREPLTEKLLCTFSPEVLGTIKDQNVLKK